MQAVSRRALLKCAAGVGAIAAGAFLKSPAALAQAAPIKLKFGNDLPATHSVNVRLKEAIDGITADTFVDWRVVDYFRVGAYYTLRWQQTGPGVVAAGQFPNITRNIVGLRLLAVLGADAKPPRREVHP